MYYVDNLKTFFLKPIVNLIPAAFYHVFRWKRFESKSIVKIKFVVYILNPGKGTIGKFLEYQLFHFSWNPLEKLYDNEFLMYICSIFIFWYLQMALYSLAIIIIIIDILPFIKHLPKF